jgi:hypothetical protein
MLGGLACPGLAAAAEIPGDVLLDMRLRSEMVEQDGFAKDAEALTLRTRLGYHTPSWRGFRALVEGSSNVALVEDYNSTANGKVRYPVVTDPESTELNRAQISWTAEGGEVVVGRQRLILGNSRFVGNSGFRQNEQTFDAAKAVLRPTHDLTLSYAYLTRIHRVFGDDNPQGRWKSDTHLLQADLKTRAGQLTAYRYLMAFASAPTQSNATSGVRFAGAWPVRADLAVTYEAEYARQTDYRNSPTRFGLDYLDLAAGLKSSNGWVSLNLERLDGDGWRGFTTPLATLHAFQGWADVFLTTPADGVRDIYLKAGRTFAVGSKGRPLQLVAEAHDFTDRAGARRYGRELDLLASWPLDRRLTLELKGAAFDGARPGYAGRTKIWMSLEYKP